MTLIVACFPGNDSDDPAVWRVASGEWHGGSPLSEFIATDEDARVIALVAPGDARCSWSSFPDLEPKQAEGVARIRAAETSIGTVHAVSRHMSGDRVVTATIAPAQMEYGIARLALRGLDPDIVLPLGLAVDEVAGKWVSAEFGGNAVLRGPQLVFPDEPVFRELLDKGTAVETLDPENLRAMLAAAGDAPLLNLREGVFAKRTPREWGSAQQRKWIARLLAGLVAASVLLALVSWAKYKMAASAENERALSAARKFDPSVQDIMQAEAQMDRALAQKGLVQGRFAPLSAGLWRAVKSTPNVSIREMRYGADGILTVILAAPDANSVNTALIKIQQDGFRVTATPRQDTSGAMLVDLTMRMP